MKPSDLPSIPADADLRAIASRCVACGLCVPHCPTYRKTGSEADSPRGRIALMDGVLARRIPASERFFRHIDLCLTCRACERACPNQVAYGRLVDGVRDKTQALRAPGGARHALRKFLLEQLIARPWRLDALVPAARRYAGSGLRRLARKSGWLRAAGLARLESQLPARLARAPRPGVYPASGAERGVVGLFLGCVARLLDGEALSAAVFVLNRLGYTVHVPARQTCCGGLHQDLGLGAGAQRLAVQNAAAFSGRDLDAIVVTASGCGARLAECGCDASSAAFSRKVRDISAYLVDADGWEAVSIAPLAQPVLVHDSCTLRNVLLSETAPYRLLRRIPGAVVEPLAGNDQCCGAAGSFFLREPEMAASLLNDKIRALSAADARYLATSNVGCARFIAAGLRPADTALAQPSGGTEVAKQPERTPDVAASSRTRPSATVSEAVPGAGGRAEARCPQTGGSAANVSARPAGAAIEVLHPVTLLARQMGFQCSI